ncbi:MAG TPA: prepilin-type N-terminal cleavage/methylation domain-containing protein [Candidatus Xenobia bacterium]|jgi:prepilin-type N-terminal cleavage/methylation domain-containing protein
MRARSVFNGVTLIEVLVVMAVFGLILATVLSFYALGANSTSATNQKMQIYRTTLLAVDRIANVAGHATLCSVDADQVVLAPVGKNLVANRVYQAFPAQAITVAVASGRVLWHEDKQTETILVLEPSQTLTFASDGNTFTIDSQDPRIRFDGPGGASTLPFEISRTTLLPAYVAPGTILPELY